MSHTNTTANYNLPQFTGTDKPSWLTDVNGAMTSIDTQMKANADANTTTAGDLSTLAGRVTTAEENITTNASSISTVANVANNAGTTATNAKREADALSAFLDINTFKDLTATVSRGNIVAQNFKSARNSDGSLGKIYGGVRISNTAGTSPITVTLSDCGLRPGETITINSGALRAIYTTAGLNDFAPTDVTISSTGAVSFSLPSNSAVSEMQLTMLPFVIFAKNFGD